MASPPVVYASAKTLDCLVSTDFDSGNARIHVNGVKWPCGLAFDRDGVLYVAECLTGKVLAIAPDGKQRTFASGFRYPAGLAIDAADNVYVGASGSITIIDPKGNAKPFVEVPLNEFITIGAFVWSTSGSGTTIYRYTLSGEGGAWLDLPAPASGLGCDKAGNVYASAGWVDGRPVIYKITQDKQVTTHITGEKAGRLDLLGFTADDLLMFHQAKSMITLWDNPSVSALRVRRSAWPEYAATRHDFQLPRD